MSKNALLSQLQLGPYTLRNRIIQSPTTRNRSFPNGVPNEVNVEYYRQRARGGCGLIITEGVLISRQGTEWPYAPGIWTKEQVAGWKKVTDAVHAEGGIIFIQLWHVGRVAHPDAPEQIAAGLPVYAPSAIAARGGKFRHIPGSPGYVKPTAIDDPQIIIEQYKVAAQNAKEAGFDGAELHSANGYLPMQFLDNTSNHRTDKWGGSVENRCRFALESLKVIIDAFGPDRVGIKLSPAGGYNDVGMPLQDTLATYKYIISEVDNMKAAYIHLARYAEIFDVEFDGKKRATPHDVVESYFPLVKNGKKLLNQSLTIEEGASLVEAGKIDAAVYGVLWITHPDLANRVRDGKPLDNAPDVKNFYGHSTDLEEAKKGYTDYPLAK